MPTRVLIVDDDPDFREFVDTGVWHDDPYVKRGSNCLPDCIIPSLWDSSIGEKF